ncbi:hypothetical protein [Streptomyces sp. TBY4]|uniref:hypothetical protein n=1 Tax=Streptomyces sp. TBY4 TaxID=2962030 RepID=UPI0020B64E4B|nr:hypothetical protein [Streptomyces sp. TBY4]MCP3753891.1 hypothetical protein [Streptomyces sp. TBY4]
MGTTQRFGSTAVEQAEAVLVEHYPHLVRLAYVTLPVTLGRHTRVLLAHKAVQRALPRGGLGAARSPAGPDGPGGPLTQVRVRVLRASLAPSGRARLAAAGLGWPPVPPFVWGLRLWPPAGGIDEPARVLGAAPGPVRAAFVLHGMDGLPEEAVARLLGAAGVPDPADAVREALAAWGEWSGGATGSPGAVAGAVAGPGSGFGVGLGSGSGSGSGSGGGSVAGDTAGETLLRRTDGGGFDAAVVSARPTDLLRRRRRTRAGWTAAAALLLAAGILAADGSPRRPEVSPLAGPAAAGTLDPARLVRVPAEAWADTARVDFTAWPARGGRTADRGLLARALAAWAARPREVTVTAAPGTATDAPLRAPQLLYAGDVAGRAVVLLLDGDRVVRYGEPAEGAEGTDAPGGPRGRELAFARTDEANVTTAAALTLSRSPGKGATDGGRARYLLAPWIAGAATRDLLRTGDGAEPLAVSADGVTEETAVPRMDDGGGAGGGCAAWPVLELTSSARIVEKHAFLLADLGALTPVHLTYTPLPDGPGAVPARQPREATGPAARAAWAPVACRLREYGGGGVRAVNIWDFAGSELPDGAGRAVWTCTRASGWAGPGDVLVQLRLPTGAPQDVARSRGTAACGRFGQHLLAGTRWKSPVGRWYLLAAGSREVTGITAAGAVRAETAGRTLAVPVTGPGGPTATLTGRLASGARITAIDGARGGRD